MSTPPGFVGAAVLFWGWQTGLLGLAAAVALVLEGSRLVAWRWDSSAADFYRVADLCRLILVAMGVYLFATDVPARAVWGLVQWFPLAVLPLLVCQAYSVGAKMDVWSFLLIVRRRATGTAHRLPDAVNLAYPYVVLCVLSASAANVRTPAFYAGVCGLSAWALWVARPRTVAPAVWVGLLVLAGALGYGGHVVLYRLQKTLEGTMLELFFSDRMDPDPYRATTALGQIGNLKLSERIVLRVVPDGGARPPILLREATYNLYNSPVWLALDAVFTAVRPEADGLTWKLRAGAAPRQRLVVSSYLKRGKGVLPLPTGVSEIERLSVLGVKRNLLGAVKVEEGLGLATYRVGFAPDGSIDGPPAEADLRLPAREAPLLSRIAAELGLAGQSPSDRLRTVADYFRTRFRYSTFLSGRGVGATALEDFLLRSRSGHCEYFATATVLLLRAAGIPARYAVGYSVQEWSGLERLYVARARHAHSWALVYVDGTWRDFDTTPPEWYGVEQAAASSWEPLYDLWSWGVFLFSRWRWGETEGGWVRYAGWLLIPLVALLVWRLRFRRRAEGGRPASERAGAAGPRAGEDSEFYLIERRLRDIGLGREPWEPAAWWIERIRAARPNAGAAEALASIVALHYRYRFDPRGISPAEREALRATAASWLAGFPAAGNRSAPSPSPGGRGTG